MKLVTNYLYLPVVVFSCYRRDDFLNALKMQILFPCLKQTLQRNYAHAFILYVF